MTRPCVLLVVMVVTATLFALAPAARLSADDDQYPGNNPQNRPGGTLIRNPATGEVFRVDGATRRLFPTPQDLDSHRYSEWIGIHDVSQDELSRLPEGPWIRAREGTVFRYAPTGAIYIIDEISPGDYRKRYVTAAGWSAYFCAGYGYTNVDSSYLGGYLDGPQVDPATSLRPDGQVVRSSSSSTDYYLLEGGQKRPFNTTTDRLSHNFAYPVCVDPAISGPSYPTGPLIRARPGTMIKATTSPAVYMVDYGWPSSYAKRQIAGPDSLAFYGFNLDPIQNRSSSEVNAYANGPHIHPVKSLWGPTWDKNLQWDDLTTHRAYGCNCGAAWNPEIDASLAAWNSAPVIVDFVDRSYDLNNDVWVDVDFYFEAWGGFAEMLYDANGKLHAHVRLNASFTASRAVAAHELGHAINLDHDGMDPDDDDPDDFPERDYLCGSTPDPAHTPAPRPLARVPQTIEDYDCYLISSGGLPLTGPVNWDYCGVNHKYPNATWGWTGC